MSRIGIFLRCAGIEDIPLALATIRDRLGVNRIQISKLADRYYTPSGIDELRKYLDEAGMQAVAVTIVHDGESYADMEAVRQTVGYLPPDTLEQRIAYSHRCVDLAAGLKIPLVTTHMGVLPTDPRDAGYTRLLHAVRDVASYAASHGVTLALETGQETAEELLTFLDKLADVPLGVNYDPANLVMYGTDEPVKSLHLLHERVLGFHAKDAVPAESSGQLGKEVRLGEGIARVEECIRYLLDVGYTGSFIVENYLARRGSIEDKLHELQFAKQFLHNILDPSGAMEDKIT